MELFIPRYVTRPGISRLEQRKTERYQRSDRYVVENERTEERDERKTDNFMTVAIPSFISVSEIFKFNFHSR